MTPAERALADPAFRERLRDEYPGRYDVDDALVWLQHPDAPDAAGAPSPFGGLDALRRTVYAPEAGERRRERYRRRRAEYDRFRSEPVSYTHLTLPTKA